MWKRVQYSGDGMPYNYSVFVCDSASDLATLPTDIEGVEHRCCSGSKAIVTSTNKKYILNLSNVWVEDKSLF